MATFPSIKPTYGQRKKSQPKTRTIRFADGYEHRLLFGLAQHQNPKEFTFTPPGESSSSEFVCENWSKSIPYNNRATIQATFREVFEPAS